MGTINFDGSAEYSQKGQRVLAIIENNPAGQVIVSGIRISDHDLTIAPYTDQDCQAKTHPHDPSASAPKGVWEGAPKDARWYVGRDDDPSTRRTDERYTLVKGKGTGTGSDVTILFTPDIYGKSGCHSGVFGSLADEVLFHEMVHAFRQIQGKYNQIPMGPDQLTGYGNEEEFLAIVATNVYISAKGSSQLRADHVGHTQLMPPLDTSAGFLTDPDNLKKMNIYRLVWADTFLRLSFVVAAAFNPFRELTLRLQHLGTVGRLW